MEIPFYKLEANGNDYLLILEECVNKNIHVGHLISKMSDKNYGIGSDGAIILSSHYRPIPYMEIYNNDGNKVALSINGLSIVSKYLFDTKYKDKEFIKIKTDTGIYEAMNTLNNIIIKVKITNTLKEEKYVLNQKQYQLYFNHIGNKQIYLINKGHINPYYFRRTLGKQLSQHYDCHVGLMTPHNPYSFSIMTYERGGKITQSCGSNICGGAMLLKEKELIKENEDIEVDTLGGNLMIKINNQEVLYCPTTSLICKGTYYI